MTPTRNLPSLLVRPTTTADLDRLPEGVVAPADYVAVVTGSMTVVLGGDVVAIRRTDDYPGEEVWTNPVYGDADRYLPRAVEDDAGAAAVSVWSALIAVGA